jgi:hypothetical protein
VRQAPGRSRAGVRKWACRHGRHMMPITPRTIFHMSSCDAHLTCVRRSIRGDVSSRTRIERRTADAPLISTPRGPCPEGFLGFPSYRRRRNPMTTSNARSCPICPGHGVPLGTLGRLRWYRCRDCGMDFNRPARTRTGSRPTPQREGVRLG